MADAASACTVTRKRNNDWRQARLRLITLRTIAQMDLWSDARHGTKVERDKKALSAWEVNLKASKVDFHSVTRWSTIDEHATKWVDDFTKLEKALDPEWNLQRCNGSSEL